MAEENTKVKSIYYTTNNPQPETQPDWNQNDPTAPDYIKNRIGGYYETQTFEDIVWDGNTDGRESITLGGSQNLYKISDFFIDSDTLIGKTYTLYNSEEDGNEIIFTITSKMIVTLSNTLYTIDDGNIIVSNAACIFEGITIPSPGIYFF